MWIPKQARHSWVVGLLLFGTAFADTAPADSSAMRSLDEQVQQVKSDVLDIASELALLEEQLLYPANTQLAIFLALDPEQDLRVDAVHITLNGEQATHHIYSFQEVDALHRGGVQRLYTGNIPRGEHALDVAVVGKAVNGDDFSHAHSFTFRKDVEPRMLGLTLSGANGAGLTLTDW